MSPWLRPLRADAAVRLVCFPYAGGGVAEFARWRLHVPAAVEVAAIAIPGRDGRLSETPHRRVEPLADAIAAAIGPSMDRPFAFYGHSMGAAIAVAVADRLRARNLPLPKHLFLGARGGPRPAAAPADGPRPTPVHALPEDAFIDALQARYQAIPAALLADRALLGLFLPALRADMEIAETADLSGIPRLPIPTTVFVGSDDATATPADAARWAPYVGEPFAVRTIEGGHFFLKGPNKPLLDAIVGVLG